MDFGTPSHITWYRNGSVIATTGQGGTTLNADGGLFLNVSAARGTGIYKATVVANGKTYETNEIEISSNEDQAVIESFTIEDDYTDGTDVVYEKNDTRAVATVTLNKNYQGTFSLYKKTNTKFAGAAIDTMETAANTPALSASDYAGMQFLGLGDGASVLTADAGTNYNALNMQRTAANPLNAPAGEGIGYIARDGKVTYKWVVTNAANTTGLTRGEEYVLVFDQDSIATDNIGSGNENKFKTAISAPYVTTPAKAEITKAAKNAAVEITFKDANDKVMTFMGMQNPIVGADTVGMATGSDIYSATKLAASTSDASKKKTNIAAGTIRQGVWTTATEVSGSDAFWFAELKFEKGIYGKDEVKVRTNDVQVAYDAASGMKISYATSAPKDVKVSFTNLRTDSTVYLVALQDADGARAAVTAATVSNETAEAAFKRVYNDPTQAIASKSVSKGEASMTFEGAIEGVVTGDANGATGTLTEADIKNGNSYIAIIVPDDDVNYSPTYTAAANGAATAGGFADGEGIDIAAKKTSYKLVGKKEFKTGASYADATVATPAAFDAKADTAIVAVDQFGNEMTSNNVEATTAVDMTLDNPTVAVAQTNVMTLQTTPSTYNDPATTANPDYPNYSVITLAAKAGTTSVNTGETFTLKLSTGQIITIKSKNGANSTTPVALADVVWSISIS